MIVKGVRSSGEEGVLGAQGFGPNRAAAPCQRTVSQTGYVKGGRGQPQSFCPLQTPADTCTDP